MGALQDILVPDIGDFKNVEIIEVNVSPGDRINQDDPLITLESDKATMEVPSPMSGVVAELKVAVGDRVSQGSPILSVEAGEAQVPEQPSPQGMQETDVEPARPPAPEMTPPRPKPSAPPEQLTTAATTVAERPAPISPPLAAAAIDEAAFAKAHASPSVRRFARELGADLGKVRGSGPKGRILEEDVQAFVKAVLSRPIEAPPAPVVPMPPAGGLAVAEMPEIDFSQFGETETRALTKTKKLSGAWLHRNWVTIPHVTHQEEADITELEVFRKEMSEDAKKQGFRLTMIAFLLKASVAALKRFPDFNASLDRSRENLILKRYFNIGVAVDTPEGLVVPVIRNVDRKGIFELAKELGEFSEKARARKLTPADMSGGCFTISSLGGIGGTGFTPIVNAPEVAILGVTRSRMMPVYREGEFVPRLILPLSLSYDHRVIDGAAAARFAAFLSFVLGDVRRLVL
jgi:pyruvate dehydrogenase E2 component (dihydrolipoyllysine-residue acetyltransferase)